MFEIKRKIDSYLDDYFETGYKQALLITGARQIGKTYSIRKFCSSHFENVIELNFLSNPEFTKIFDTSDPKDILLKISAISKVPMEKGKTVIFLDEVQKCPEIITAIKFLVDEGSYFYILSGSLLGVELKDIRSVPVGYLSTKQMYPLDFEEFIIANGLNEDVIKNLENNFNTKTPVDSFIHKKIMDLYRLYLLIGGMPEAVTNYLEHNDLLKVTEIQNHIIYQYKKDIGQYDPEHKLYIEEIYNLIPPELNAKNKRFIFKNLNENLKFARYENSFIWLKDAGVALPVYNVEEPTYPLKLAQSRNLFKLFTSDVGLLASQYSNDFQLKILNNEVNINYGSIYENAVAQELVAHGFELYYFNSKKQGELDFVIEHEEEILPIEVKSGKDYERHTALHNVLSDSSYDIHKAIVLCNENIKTEGITTYLPIYMTMFLHKKKNKSLIYKIDLGPLGAK